MKNQTIILTAGMSSRMKTYEPRSLLKIKDDTTLIEHQIKLVQQNFGCNIDIVIGFKGQKIQKKLSNSKINLVENNDFESSNTGYGLEIALNNDIESLLIFHGDLLFNKEVFNVNKNKSFLIVDTKNQIKDKEVGLVINNGTAANLSYGLKPKWCQIAYFTNSELSMLKELKNKNISNLFLFEIINKIIDMGGVFECYEPKNMKIIEIDCVKDFKNDKVKNINCP